jgi:glycerophosphoryl diester phosphodiesterase
MSPPIALNSVEVHGHRGCRGLRPENTLPAFLHALSLGVDVLELDVVISADNQVVVSHEPWFNPQICLDPEGQPIENSPSPRVNLYQLSYATIRRYDCGLRRHPGFPEQISEPAYKPLLQEVFAALAEATRQIGRPPVRYSIEIKSSPAGDNVFHPEPSVFSSLVFAELQAAQVLPRTTVLSFDPRILRAVHQLDAELGTCLLLEDDLPWPVSIQLLGFVPTVLGPDFNTVTSEAVQQLRTSFPRLRLVPWTVNRVQDIQRIQALGVDGITTDYPDRLISLLKPGSV